MKKTILCIFILSFASTTFARETSPRISVTRFQQEVDHLYENCEPFSFTTQNQLQTEMEHDLSREGLKVLERRNIREVYENEYELPNLNRKSRPKTGQFLSAQYTITGGIAELGICQDSSGTGVQLGGLISLLGGPQVDLRGAQRNVISKVKVIAQLISVETGEAVHSFEAFSEISDKSFGVEGGAMGVGASHGSRSRPPIEKATNQAIQDLARQIADYLNDSAKES